MDTYFSNFNTHLFLVELSSLTAGNADAPLPPQDLVLSNEIDNVTMFTPPGVTKDIKRVKVLSGEGWDEIIPLGQAAGDAQLSFVRPAAGKYTGSASTDTYSKLRYWFDNGIAQQVGAYRCLVYARPRQGTSAREYEGTAYIVLPTEWQDGAADPDNGQEYTMTLAVQRKPYAITLTESSGTFTWDVT